MSTKRKTRRRWYVFSICALMVFGFYSIKYLRARTIIHKGVETIAIVLAVKGGTKGEALYTDYYGAVHEISGYIGKEREVGEMIPLYYMGQKPDICVVPDDTLLFKAEVSGVVTALLTGYSIYVTILYIRQKKKDNPSKVETEHNGDKS